MSDSSFPTPLRLLTWDELVKLSTAAKSPVLGTHNGQSVRLGDSERGNGLYILGKPRMGKSWLMINLAVQDAQDSDRGIFFIDPHGEAAEEILNQIRPDCRSYKQNLRYLLIDPTSRDYTFTINPLQCVTGTPASRSYTIHDPVSRSHAFTRTKGIFDKLWKNTFEEKPWLQLILQNTIYAFIENKGYTIVDFPVFFSDPDFRNHIVSNMQYNTHVKDYWQKTFASKSRLDRDRIMDAAQTRCEIMLGHPIIRDVFGYFESTIDFKFLTSKGYVILVKLPHTLPHEVKTILGTLLVSEFKHAIEIRPPGSPKFSVFIDEFQNFVSFEDMSTLITQAPKFGVATTLAHHDRYGQLGDNKEIIGATGAIANKVLFQITGKDAHDFAPEFRKDPPTETRYEDVFVISQNPFYDLLLGHRNPQIRKFVNAHLRPLKERSEDIGTDALLESYIRMDFLDEANLFRIDERIEGADHLHKDLSVVHGKLKGAGQSIEAALSQTENLKQLALERQQLRISIREMNSFFTDVMEGKLSPGQEAFNQFLIRNVRTMVSLSEVHKKALEYYILITHGNALIPRAIEYVVAKEFGIYPQEIKRSEELEVKEQDYLQQKYIEWVCDFHFDPSREPKKAWETTPPDLPPRILTQSQLADVQSKMYEALRIPIRVIDELIRFCVLLAKPENHLEVKVKQREQKEVQTRTIADMVNEMEGELTELPKYTAYAKVLQGRGMWRGKIETLGLKHAPITDEARLDKPRGIIMYWNLVKSWVGEIMERYFYVKRTKIEEETRKRQEGWRVVPKTTLIFPPDMMRKWPPDEKKPKPPDDEPPPTSY